MSVSINANVVRFSWSIQFDHEEKGRKRDRSLQEECRELKVGRKRDGGGGYTIIIFCIHIPSALL